MWEVYAETGKAKMGVAFGSPLVSEGSRDEFSARASFARTVDDLEAEGYEITQNLYDEEAEAAYEDEARRWRGEGIRLKRAVFMDHPDGRFAVVLLFYREDPEY